MGKLLVAPDVPQWLLNEFNDLDFKSIKLKAMKNQLLKALIPWANQNVPRKIKSKVYESNGEKKVVSKDFDKQLLDLLNAYDYTQLSGEQERLIKEFIGKYKHMLPLKKK